LPKQFRCDQTAFGSTLGTCCDARSGSLGWRYSWTLADATCLGGYARYSGVQNRTDLVVAQLDTFRMKDETLSVPCPTCGSRARQRCVLNTGRPRVRSQLRQASDCCRSPRQDPLPAKRTPKSKTGIKLNCAAASFGNLSCKVGST